jgi:hypothetical protein
LMIEQRSSEGLDTTPGPSAFCQMRTCRSRSGPILQRLSKIRRPDGAAAIQRRKKRRRASPAPMSNRGGAKGGTIGMGAFCADPVLILCLPPVTRPAGCSKGRPASTPTSHRPAPPPAAGSINRRGLEPRRGGKSGFRGMVELARVAAGKSARWLNFFLWQAAHFRAACFLIRAAWLVGLFAHPPVFDILPRPDGGGQSECSEDRRG